MNKTKTMTMTMTTSTRINYVTINRPYTVANHRTGGKVYEVKSQDAAGKVLVIVNGLGAWFTPEQYTIVL